MAYEWARWLADVLRDAGCIVVESDGWRDRGRPGGSFTPRGIMLHHDASPAGETSTGDDVLINGRPDLEGPLCNLWLDYDGRWHTIGAGRANHAGEGQWQSIPRDAGNTYTLGIETDHTTDEDWTAAQQSEALRGVAALADHLGIRTEHGLWEWFTAHKEYAAGRKIDPDPLNMDYARDQLLHYTGGDAPVRKVQKTTWTDKVIEPEWKILKFTDADPAPDGGQFCTINGPCAWFASTVEMELRGPAGAEIQLQAYREENDVVKAEYPGRTYVVPASGTARIELHQQGTMNDPGERLRVRARTAGTVEVTATFTGARTAAW